MYIALNMNDIDFGERVRACMAKVFDIDPALITLESSPETIEAWDSLGHLNLIMALEDEFGVNLSDDQFLSLTNFAAVVTAIQRQIK